MDRKKAVTLAVVAVAIAIAGVLWARSSSSTGASGNTGHSPDRGAERGAPSRAGDLAPPGDRDALVATLRSRYGAHIEHPYVQIKMLEKLIGYFREHEPDRWQQAVLETLRAAFPDRYAELAANLQRWLEYERWTYEQRTALQGMSEAERRAAIRAARERIFGKEADTLWASEIQGQEVSDALRAADAMPGATVSERLERYKEGLEETYQERTEPYLERHRQEVMDRFLDLDSVQKDLGTLGPEEREQRLREIRQGLGMPEEALQRWEALDHERDTRWDAGARYMQEREALAKQYSGEALEQRLREIRTRYFGAEADTIATEEQSGFFRFSRPRRWGRN